MAVTATKLLEIHANKKRVVFGSLAWDNSYPTGGEAITLNQLGLSVLEQLLPFPSLGYVPSWDGSESSPLVLLYWVDTTVDGAPLAEVADTTDVSAITEMPVIAIGR